MRTRPHHLIDIVTQYGAGEPFKPSDYGHAVHTVAARLIAEPETVVELGVGADEICVPCRHLVDGRCRDVIRSIEPPVSKHDYNDALDLRLLAFLGISEGDAMTFTRYLALLREHLSGLAELCAWPGEAPDERHRKLTTGLDKLGA